MAISDIPNPNPITVPATGEKVFDKQFCPRLEITAHPAGTGKPWTAKFVGHPYDGNEIRYPSFQVELQDLKALSLLDAELAQAMGAVLAVIGKYLVKCKMKNKHIVTVDNVEEILE
jgi:hypothetical protein